MNIEILNTNIHDYSIDELYSLLKLNDPTKEEIIKKVEFLKSNFFTNKPKIIDFLTKIENKLLDHIISRDLNSNINTNNMTDNESIISDNESTLSDNESTLSNNESTLSDNESIISDNESTLSKNENENEKINFELIKKNPDVIENYYNYQFLHFNTEFRTKIKYGESTLESNNIDSQANSTFKLSTPINNISQIKLSSINFKKPYLVSEYKENNKFTIKKYSSSAMTTCDVSHTIILEDGYYNTYETLKTEINKKIEIASDISNIQVSINTNSEKLTFESSNISYFQVDFLTHYTSKYSLANILGFDKLENYYSSSNNKIESPNKTIINDTNDYFFCFNEYKSNIIETHKLYLDKHLSKQKILAKINSLSGSELNNFFIHETFSINDLRYDIIRQYHGLINLSKFDIKIIDYYGNIINTQNNITFTLEVKIYNSKLITKD